MLEYLNGFQMLVIGMTTGVVGSFLIYATYTLMGRKAAKARLDEFLARYGALKGINYYTQKLDDLEDPTVRAKVATEYDRLVALIRESERLIDAIIATDPSQKSR